MAAPSAAEASGRYDRFLEDRGFVMLRKDGGPDFTAESAGGVHTVVVVPCCLTGVEVSELHKTGTAVVFSGPVDRKLVDRLTTSTNAVVWWTGSSWNGSG